MKNFPRQRKHQIRRTDPRIMDIHPTHADIGNCVRGLKSPSFGHRPVAVRAIVLGIRDDVCSGPPIVAKNDAVASQKAIPNDKYLFVS